MKAMKIILLAAWFIGLNLYGNHPGITSTLNTRVIGFTVSSEDTIRINTIVRRGFTYFKSKDVKIGLIKETVDSAFLLCERLKVETPSLLHLLNANYLFFTGDYRQLEEEALTALDKAKNNGEFAIMARVMLFLGNYYQRIGFFGEGDDYFNNSIELAQKKEIKGIITKAYQGQANIYETVKDFKSFRESLEKMIDAGYRENDTTAILNALYRLGTAMTDTNRIRNFAEADSVLRRCIRLARYNNDIFFLASAYANLGWNFYMEKMYDSSMVSYKRSLQYEVTANALGNMGTIYRDLKKPETAIAYYNKSISVSRKINDWYNLSWVYQDMSNLYLWQRDTSGAFKAYVLYKAFNDSLIKTRNNQGLTDARIRYEADSHRKEVELLSLRLYNQRLIIYGFAGFLILALTIGYLLQRSARLRATKRISEMKRQIAEITQANLRQQMNPHFIFNTLNSIQYFMYQHDKLATNNYLTKFSNLMRKVLENSQHTSIPISDELAALSLYLELESIRFKDRFDYSIKVDEEIDPMMYKVPTMIIQPYVENSINHGLMPKEGKGSVSIDLKLEKDFIICTIEDDGIGREASRERNLKKGTNHNSLGTQITNSRLELVNSLYGSSLKTVFTDLKNEKGEAIGTRVVIHIPIMI